jgi:tetratricopeptide (TPR) repeat protein
VSRARPVTDVPSEARDLFARGRYLAQRHESDDYRKAIVLFERTVALAPDFAPAYSQLAMCQDNLAVMAGTPVKAAVDEVERNAKRALELDPLDSDAQTTLANIAWRIDHDWPRAEQMFVAALRLAPNSARTHRVFGTSMIYIGRYVEGLQHVRIALDLDPLNLTSRAAFALGCSYARDYDSALREYESVIALEPHHLLARVMIGMTHMWRGDPAAARPHFEQAVTIAPEHPIPSFDLAMCIGATGDVAEGRRLLDAHVARIGDAPYARYNRAQAEAFLGNRTAAMAWLHQSAALNEALFNILPVDPTFDSYRDHPDFSPLLGSRRLRAAPPSPYAAAR